MGEVSAATSPNANRVLVVEDSRTVAMLLVNSLKKKGWVPEHASTLKESFSLLEAHPFDLALLDLTLPDAIDLSGLQAIRERWPSLTVVILTGHDDEQLALDALAAGAQDYLVKGDHESYLARTLRFAVQRNAVMTRLDKLTREVQAKNAELEVLNALKDQFLGMAAHDLRNPLGVIAGYAKLLAAQLVEKVDESQLGLFERIQMSSEFMLSLVNDLLDVSAIESGELNLECKPTDIGKLVEENAETNNTLAVQKNIKVEFDAPEKTVLANLDPGRIEQVLNNFVSNAVKYSHAGTSVHVSVRAEGREARVTVTDEGQGIPEDEQKKLFQAFSRTSVKTTGGEKSTGLGLSICKRIIEAHGGTVGVQSHEGRGSSFFFTLPLSN